MRLPKASTALWIFAPTLFVVAVAILVNSQTSRPAMRTASMAEIRAMLPPELLVDLPPVDPAAVRRFEELQTLSTRIDAKLAVRALNEIMSASHRPDAAIGIWQSYPGLLARLARVLDAGPILWPTPRGSSQDVFDTLIPFTSLSRSLAAGARAYALRHDLPTSLLMLRLGTKLSERIWASGGIERYIWATLYEGIAIGAVQDVVSTFGLPAPACVAVLANLSPAPMRDDRLATAFLWDFQEVTLKQLPDPTSPEAVAAVGGVPEDEPKYLDKAVSTYDAVETARVVGKAVVIEMKNALRPFSQFDRSAQIMLENEAKSDSRNSLGCKKFMNSEMAGSVFIVNSDQIRAQRDLVRIVLASRIYRAAHGGRLPSSIDGFVPILGAWPLDPFNGKPMIYNPVEAVAYSVGRSLVNGGGKVGPRSSIPWVSLK